MTSTLTKITAEQYKRVLESAMDRYPYHYSAPFVRPAHYWECYECGLELTDPSVLLWDTEAELAVCPECDNEAVLAGIECAGC